MNSLTASRLTGRLFYCLISLLLAVRLAHASGPATTIISDIVYRGDGTPAAGTLLISWPAFISADAHSVAAGSMNLTIGAAGAISLALVPNVGADPAGTYYTVVYQLSDGTSSTEYWSVPATSPTTIAAVRSVVAPPMVASQFVSKTYVDALPYAGTGACNPSQYVYSDDERSSPACRGVGAQRFADQYANIQAAITDAGSSGSVVIPASYTGSDTYTNPNNINIVDLRGKPDRYKGFVNVVTDCGAKGDGATDDYNAIQSCLNNNPGRHVFFPKMCGSQSGGGTVSWIDYKSGHSIT